MLFSLGRSSDFGTTVEEPTWTWQGAHSVYSSGGDKTFTNVPIGSTSPDRTVIVGFAVSFLSGSSEIGTPPEMKLNGFDADVVYAESDEVEYAGGSGEVISQIGFGVWTDFSDHEEVSVFINPPASRSAYIWSIGVWAGTHTAVEDYVDTETINSSSATLSNLEVDSGGKVFFVSTAIRDDEENVTLSWNGGDSVNDVLQEYSFSLLYDHKFNVSFHDLDPTENSSSRDLSITTSDASDGLLVSGLSLAD